MRVRTTTATVYSCTLKEGLTFSDGSELDSEDVKASFDRNLAIADPQGASSLYLNMKNIETPDPQTVVFNLKASDSTWPFLLTSGGAAIAPAEYPADKVQPSDQVIGSGRYTVAEYEPGQQTVLEANPEYTGDDPAQVDRVIIQYYDKALDAEAGGRAGRGRRRLPLAQPDRHRRPRGRRRRPGASTARVARSATSTSTSTSRRAPTSRRRRSARPLPR